MQSKTIKLPESFISKLVNLPESGMGYQIIKVILRNGTVLRRQKVLNSEYLMLEENRNFLVEDIKTIELESE